MEMTPVNISWTQFGILAHDFMFDPYILEEHWMVEEVNEWILDYRAKGYAIELEEYFLPWVGPDQITKRLEGVTVKFCDPGIAALFKLTWGGK